MGEIRYSVTGPSFDKKYGIVAVDQSERHSAAVSPFLRTREEAERMAAALNVKQVPIADFCSAFAEGSLTKLA